MGFGCVVAYAGVSAYARRSGSSDGVGPATLPTSTVLAPEPEQLRDWSFLQGGSRASRDAWRERSLRSLGIRANLDAGDATWLDTVASLESLFFEAEERLACAARYGASVRRACMVRFDLGLHRESDSSGRVVFAEASLVSSPESTDDASTCELLAKCLAHAKLGGVVGLPNGTEDDLAVYQLVGLRPLSEFQLDPENIRAWAEQSDAYREQLERDVADGRTVDTPSLQAKRMQLADHARYYRMRATQLELEDSR